MNVPDWNQYFINLLPWIAKRSKDPDTQVGAIIVDTDNTILSTGYNSLPRGIRDVQERCVRPEKYFWMEHAERNAIYAATGRSLIGSKIYSSLMPCMDCARGIVQVGIRECVFVSAYQNERSATSSYVEDWKRVEDLFKEAGVKLWGY